MTDCLLLVNAVMFAAQLLSKGRITAWGMKAQLCSLPASEYVKRLAAVLRGLLPLCRTMQQSMWGNSGAL